jgi:hypothetical protein
VACIIRGGQVLVPQPGSRFQVSDRLILVTSPDRQEEALKILTGEGAS